MALVVVMLGLLAALVRYLNPPQPNFTPAPLDRRSSECLKPPREFVPSNVTDLHDAALDALPQEEKIRALFRLNMEPCPCGCKFSVADCRSTNSRCEISAQAARRLIAEAKGKGQNARRPKK